MWIVKLLYIDPPGINPCPAKPVYIRFLSDFKPNNMSLKWIIHFVVDVISKTKNSI